MWHPVHRAPPDVLIYLLFNEGHLSTAEQAQSRDLAHDAEWPAALLHRPMPTEPEVAGLLALIRLHRARTAARFTSGSMLVRREDRTALCGTTRRSRQPRPC